MARALSFCFNFYFSVTLLYFLKSMRLAETPTNSLFFELPPLSLSYNRPPAIPHSVLLAGGLHWLEQPQAAPDQFPVLEKKRFADQRFAPCGGGLTQLRTIQFRFQASHRSLKNFWENRQSRPRINEKMKLWILFLVWIYKRRNILVFNSFFLCVIVCDTRESELWTLWEGVNDLLFSRTTPPISTLFFSLPFFI